MPNKFYGPGIVILTAPTREEIEFERAQYRDYAVFDPYEIETAEGTIWALQVLINDYSRRLQ